MESLTAAGLRFMASPPVLARGDKGSQESIRHEADLKEQLGE